MKTLLNDVKELLTINDACQYLEDNINRLEANHDVTELWVLYRNQTTNLQEKQIAQWELECFLFQIIDTRVFSFSYSTGENPGDLDKYPKLDEHQVAAFEYIKQRAENSVSPTLKARYNHLLWKAVKGIKNTTYSVKAIDAYFEILSNYCTDTEIKDENNNHQIGRKSKALVAAVSETKLKIPETVQLFRHLLLTTTNLKFYIKHTLIETMLKYPAVFKSGDFANTLSVFDAELKSLDSKKADNFTMAKYHLPTALKVASKVKADKAIWYSKIGECYITMGDNETDPERMWLKQQDYAMAIQNFKLAKNLARRQEAERKYAELKDEVTLPTSVIEYSKEQIAELKEVEDEIKVTTAKLLEQSSDTIYEFLAKGKFLPPGEKIKETSKNQNEAWLSGISTVKFDINKNIESISTGDEESDTWMFQYKYYIRHYVSPYLYYTLIPGIRSRKLTFRNLTSFLNTYTWIGFTLTKRDLGGDTVKYNWIAMLAPSLQEYFLQMESSLLSEEYNPNFMLAIDGLTVKFEGLFREFCTRIKAPTSTNNKGSMQEMYIHQLLKHQTIIDYFSEDDRIFFEFLFTKETGLNLRNNIAHCYFDYQDYNYGYFHLLLAALLRLAKYNFKIEPTR